METSAASWYSERESKSICRNVFFDFVRCGQKLRRSLHPPARAKEKQESFLLLFLSNCVTDFFLPQFLFLNESFLFLFPLYLFSSSFFLQHLNISKSLPTGTERASAYKTVRSFTTKHQWFPVALGFKAKICDLCFYLIFYINILHKNVLCSSHLLFLLHVFLCDSFSLIREVRGL